jgi:hypothetical protein
VACDPLQPSQYQDRDFNDLLSQLAWDQAVAANYDSYFDLDPLSTADAAAAADLSSFSTTPELHLVDYAPFLETCPPPQLFELASSSLPVPALNSTNTSLTNTPSTTSLQSPPTGPSSPDGPALLPGLKLPQQTKSSKPGRRPAAASLSHIADGRITKRAGPSGTLRASADNNDEVDADIILRRQRNNLAAKRYRQKKIDRIEELEKEVKQVTQERDELRIRLARQEAEVAALREMLKMKHSSHGSSGCAGACKD